MHNTAKFFAAIVLMSSTGAMAGISPTPLGTPPTPMGADLSLPVLAGIAAIALVAGIRYIRNKRS